MNDYKIYTIKSKERNGKKNGLHYTPEKCGMSLKINISGGKKTIIFRRKLAIQFDENRTENLLNIKTL